MPVISIKTGEAHVEIMTFPFGRELTGGQWSTPIVIPPQSEQDVELDDGMHIRARPLPIPAPPAAPAEAEPEA